MKKDKPRSTTHTQKTKDRATRTQLKPRVNSICQVDGVSVQHVFSPTDFVRAVYAKCK